MEVPNNKAEYTKHECEGIDVFLNNTIKSKNDLITITLSRFFIFRNLEVSGVDINY
ncbi:hypothetical protein [Wukongibacter baidiensis]|uniref:hypothetical protein n=1 Tax=Wukongibacter baidiensis TaxID=1723361 RepID=UPI003D7FD377